MIERAGNKVLDGIDRVREKPESTRTALVFSLTLIAGAILVALWFASLPARFQPLARAETPSASGETSYLSLYESVKKTVLALKSPAGESEKTPEVGQKPVFSRQSRIGALLKSARDVISFNFALMGAAFADF
jgi:hypothetical protein